MASASTMRAPQRALGAYLLPTLSLVLFLAAVWAIYHELSRWPLTDVMAAVAALPVRELVNALGAAALGYGVLSLYDVLAVHYLGSRLKPRRAALASFVGYAFSHTIGLPLLTGGAVRYRLYTVWGLSTLDIATIVAVNWVTLWLGIASLLALGGFLAPVEVGRMLGLPPALATALAVLLGLMILAYVLAGRVIRRDLTFHTWQVRLPSPDLALAQLLVATVDWLLAAATLWFVLPPLGVPFAAFACLFTVASVAGIISHVPAGLGVFEAVLLLAMPAQAHLPGVAAGLLLYRLIYYVLPVLVAALLFAWHQSAAGRDLLVERLAPLHGAAQLVLPNLLATLTFIAGAILLISGATPAVADRIAWLAPMAPMALIELSHFLGSLTGLALLVLAIGLRRRLDGAWWATVALLAAGVLFSLAKGFDWEEALYLSLVLAALLPCHGAFYRRSRLIAQRFSPSWMLAILAVVLGSIWLGLFSYRHIDYANQLWWEFVLEDDAPRFLRATAGVMIGVVLLAGLQLTRFAPPAVPIEVTTLEPERFQELFAKAEQPSAHAWLALLGDKRFLFSESGRSFIMYGIQGRTWVVMGEPVGLRSERLELLWRFRELCDRFGGRPVFYEMRPGLMPDLIELGLTFLKLGEQAYVPLRGFTLDGSARSGLRQSRRRAQREGASFEIVGPEQFDEILPELRAVSDAWLESKTVKEKGFSLGRFEPDYLRHCPIALVRKEGQIVAFANLWPTPDRSELSIDLMRFRDGAVRDVMEYLFIELMVWGAAQGFERFDLGMAPLSGLNNRALSPLWTRAGALLFRYGEQFYNFEGLRRYKEKFRPVWEPRYLGAPGGLTLAAVLADVTALISGGAGGVLRK